MLREDLQRIVVLLLIEAVALVVLGLGLFAVDWTAFDTLAFFGGRSISDGSMQLTPSGAPLPGWRGWFEHAPGVAFAGAAVVASQAKVRGARTLSLTAATVSVLWVAVFGAMVLVDFDYLHLLLWYWLALVTSTALFMAVVVVSEHGRRPVRSGRPVE